MTVGTGRAKTGPITLRAADAADAKALHGLITAVLDEGHLLPRSFDEVTVHAARFVVAVRRRKIVGCAELAPLSGQLAEVRSLAVHPSARHQGVGAQIVAEVLSVRVDRVKVVNTDTDVKPWDVGVHASRTTFVAGNSALMAVAMGRADLTYEALILVRSWSYKFNFWAYCLLRKRHRKSVLRLRRFFQFLPLCLPSYYFLSD